LLVVPVTAPLDEGSFHGAVGITSLSAGRERGWVVEDLYNTRYDATRMAIVVELADRPINDLIRVIVKGTGPRPVMGADPMVPLAGLVGGPPGTKYDGHDAVWTFENTLTGRGNASTSAEPPAGNSDDGKEADR
jgi:hypothetical protein